MGPRITALLLGLTAVSIGGACEPTGTETPPTQTAARRAPDPATPGVPIPPRPVPEAVEPSPPPVYRALVKLIIIGEFPVELTDGIERGLRDELQVDVERIEGVPLPAEAYYPPRRRYRAERLLRFLNDHLEGEPTTTRVLGMTSVDISTTKPPYEDWGIFGLGELGGRSCVISTFRLSRRARDEAHRQFRVVTTAVHEVGHTLGLEHCVEDRCVMRDAEGSIRTVDTSTGHLGPECRAEVDEETPLVLPAHPAE